MRKSHRNWKTEIGKERRIEIHPGARRAAISRLYSEILLLIGLFFDGKVIHSSGP